MFMESVLINTTPQHKHLYAIKRFEDEIFTMPIHMHERFELTCIIKGCGTRIIGDHVKNYNDGDVVLMAPYTSHHWQSDVVHRSEVSAVTLFFSSVFPSDDFLKLPEFNNVKGLLEAAKYGIELKGKLRKSVADQLQALKNDYSLGQILKILALLNEIAESKEYNVLMSRGYAVLKKNDRERVTQIVSYIKEHLSQRITVQKLADIACMHTGSVNRFFKQATGFTLVEYINLMRIGKACDLLSTSSQKTSDIAGECGFSNLSYFNRTFKRVKNITPREYRKQFYK